jgi:hypothetical protein
LKKADATVHVVSLAPTIIEQVKQDRHAQRRRCNRLLKKSPASPRGFVSDLVVRAYLVVLVVPLFMP